MAPSQVSQKAVHAAFKDVVPQSILQHPKLQEVTKFVRNKESLPDIKALIKQHDFDAICAELQRLLKTGVIKSVNSSTQDRPKQAQQANSSEKKAQDSDSVKQSELNVGNRFDSGDPSQNHSDTVSTFKDWSSAGVPKMHTPYTKTLATILLESLYIPFDIQHRIFTKVQKDLEFACYALIRDKWPEYLEAKRLSCAEAIELDQCPHIFMQIPSCLDGESLQRIGKSLQIVYRSINELRNKTVHRHHLSAQEIEHLLSNAETFATLLYSPVTVATISNFRKGFQSAFHEIREEAKAMHSEIAKTRKDLDSQRNYINRLETEACQDFKRKDNESRMKAAMKIETYGSSTTTTADGAEHTRGDPDTGRASEGKGKNKVPTFDFPLSVAY